MHVAFDTSTHAQSAANIRSKTSSKENGMNQKLLDYEKVLKVIRSCKTNAQNQVAYRMVWNFQDKYKDDTYTRYLFIECDMNLQYIIAGKVTK